MKLERPPIAPVLSIDDRDSGTSRWQLGYDPTRLCELAEGGVPTVLLQRMSPFMADTVEKGF
jgi:hypothetical protein